MKNNRKDYTGKRIQTVLVGLLLLLDNSGKFGASVK
jgi:hypothetical protein